MVLICGIPSEPSLALVIDELRKLKVPHLVLSQRCFSQMRLWFQVRDGGVTGRMEYRGAGHPLKQFSAM